jgi:hypothetical protein
MRFILILTAIFALLLSGAAFAQGPIDKGSLQLGGGISFQSWGGDLYENGDGDGETDIEFNPFVNYFITNGLAIGGEIQFFSASQGDAKASGFGIGPQISYYFNVGQATETKGRIFPYIGASFTYLSTTSNGGDPTDVDIKFSGTEIGLFGGADYMLNNYVAVFGQLEYDMHSLKMKEPVEGDSESGTVMQLFTGFTFFLY